MGLASIFVFELLLRICAEGPTSFFCSGCSWNWLDFILVAASLVELFVAIFYSLGNSAENHLSNLRALRVVRITRLLRIFRITRIVRYVAALRTLIYSITVTLRSLSWAMVLLMLIMYVFAVTFTQLIYENHEAVVGSQELHFWKDMYASLLTLFKVICNGVDWHDTVEPLRRIHFVVELVLVVYVAFTYFTVLNVVTGVFCSSAVAAAENDPDLIAMNLAVNEERQRRQLNQLFTVIDLDGSGRITIDELEKCMRDHSVQGVLVSMGIQTHDAWTLFQLIDADGSDLISVEEFAHGLAKLQGHAKSLDFARLANDSRWMMRRMVQLIDLVDKRLSAMEKVPDEKAALQAVPGTVATEAPVALSL